MASPNTATASAAAAGPQQIRMPGLGNQPDGSPYPTLNLSIVLPAPVVGAVATVAAGTGTGTPRPSDADIAMKVRVAPIRLTNGRRIALRPCAMRVQHRYRPPPAPPPR